MEHPVYAYAILCGIYMPKCVYCVLHSKIENDNDEENLHFLCVSLLYTYSIYMYIVRTPLAYIYNPIYDAQ